MWGVLLLCAFFAVCEAPRPPPSSSRRVARETHSAQQLYDLLFNLYRGRAHGGGGRADLAPFPVDLPLHAGGPVSGANVTTLPVLVLPLPVLVSVNNNSACEDKTTSFDTRTSFGSANTGFGSPSLGSAIFGSPSFGTGGSSSGGFNSAGFGSVKAGFGGASADFINNNINAFNDGDGRAPPPSDEMPHLAVTSEQLVEQFIAQAPVAPHLPPAVIAPPPPLQRPQPQPPSVYYNLLTADPSSASQPQLSSAADPLYQPYSPSGDPPYPPAGPPPQQPRGFARPTYLPPPATEAPRSGAPPRPRLAPSLVLRGTITVPRADYTEPYTAWWSESSGAARVEFHNGNTTCLRAMLPDGAVQRLEMRIDRTGEPDVRRCAVSQPSPAAASDRFFPALPDLDTFSFGEYREEGEVWRLEMRGAPGELGGARGEALTFRHELLLKRGAAGDAVPVRYSVEIDSSVLGTNCDGYIHQYQEVRAQDIDPAVFTADLDRQCEVRESLDTNNKEHFARLEPLKEFTMLWRDPRYDEGITRFVQEFDRKYSDVKEEAVRKNLFVQHSRFINSCNREGGTFQVEVNFLGDRLDVELDVLQGALFDESRDSDGAGGALVDDGNTKLPDEFDWRPRGAVTTPRYQGSCSSCWAFAVVASVEGALFIKTRALVPLSEQTLVDCGKPFGANGCRGTWPVHAFEYVRARGLPARDEYTPYAERVLACRAPPVPAVTRISGHLNVPPNNINALKVAIRRHAPTVVVIDAKAKSFLFYKKGVLMDERCVKGPKKKLNHAVTAVGWGLMRGEPHFILKNSYSAAWGDGGFVRVHAPSNTCGVLTTPSVARLRRPDVQRLPPGASTAPPSGDDADYADD